jgi:acyl transferase domain-containing protein/acyl carrier protein/ubiquinone/menaquinone biosynthesis C-methylase UbiE
MEPLAVDSGIAAWRSCMQSERPVVLVAAGDPRKLSEYLAPAAAVPAGAPADALLDVLRETMAGLLKLDAATLNPAISFHEYGFDSITLKEFASSLNRRLGTALSPAIFFAQSNLAALAEHMRELARPIPQAAGDARTSPQEVRPGAAEAIAVIGMHGRFPGCRDLQDYWEHLQAGDDLIASMPEERQRLCGSGSFGPGGFIDGVDRFDADFFQIARPEAELMDPQHRLFLQTVWQALEDAAVRPLGLAGTRTGVFVGVQSMDYALLAAGAGDPQVVPGTSHAVLANRISYLLDLHGPSEAIDTACSSSLVAVHRAAESIRAGECEMAIAGGVNLLLSRSTSAAVAQMGALSPSGRSSPFSAEADGYVRGEGVGAVVLKKLSRALADGDPIQGVILASGVNHGGRASSLTAPNSNAQADLLCEVWSKAGVPAATITCLEAHGTGTELGDPVETQGIRAAFERLSGRQGTALPAGFCALGSVKSNIGHLEPASGMAGMVKMLLALRHGVIPKTLHAEHPNPHMRLENGPLSLAVRTQPWEGPVPRRAGISSFGFGGVNAHVLLEEAPAGRAGAPPDERPAIFPLSARSAAALRRAVEGLRAWMNRNSAGMDRDAIGATLQLGREQFGHRLAIVAASVEDLGRALDAWLSGAADTLGVYGGAPAGAVSLRELAGLPAAGVDPRDWTGGGRHAELARLWSAGTACNWALLHAGGKPRRESLPLYSFDEESFWYTPPAPAQPHPKPHPLIDVAPSANGAVYSKTLTASAWFMRDHQVHGNSVLPASAILEMARAAAAAEAAPLTPSGLENVVWLAPVTANGADSRILIQLERPDGAEGERRLQFKVVDAAHSNGHPNAQGEVVFGRSGEGHPRVDLEAVRQRCREDVSSSTLYAELERAGLRYGETFRLLENVWRNGTEALGCLHAPLARHAELRLHPAVMDAAVQTAAGLFPWRGAMAPFSVERVEILGDTQQARYAWARSLPGAGRDALWMDITVADREGTVLAELHRFCARPMQGNGVKPRLPGLREGWQTTENDGLPHFFQPVWKASAAADGVRQGTALVFRQAADLGIAAALKAAHPGRIVEVHLGRRYRRIGPDAWELDARNRADFARILGAETPSTVYFLAGMPAEAEPVEAALLEETQQLEILPFYRLVQAAEEQRLLTPALAVRVVTCLAQRVTADDRVRPLSGAMGPLCRSLAEEFPAVSWRAVDVDAGDPSGTAEGLLGEPTGAHELEVAYRAGMRYALHAEPVVLAKAAELPLRHGGSYLIVGGAGGLGATFARYLAERWKARVALVGRRVAGAASESLIREIRSLGGDAMYLAADAADPEAMQRATAEVRRQWGGIQGLLHSALILRNAPAGRMQDDDLLDALRPKAAGMLSVIEALRPDALEFVAVFSSAISLTGGAGQSNYAAACGLQDALTRYWSQMAACPVRLIHWGFWGETGIVATPEHRELLARRGVGSICAAEGIDAFERILSSPAEAVMPIKLLTSTAHPPDANRGAVPRQAAAYLKSVFAEILRVDAAGIVESQPHEMLGIDSLVMMQITRRMEQDLGPLPKTLFFEHLNLGDLADRVAREFPQRFSDGEPASAAHAARPAVSETDTDKDMDAIAVVGIAGRYPQARDIEEFWRNLRTGRDCLTDVPASRWNHARYFQPGEPRKDATYSDRGGFLDEIDKFDAAFFGISPREANGMDPQERLFLETAWSTLEDAGYTMESLAESAPGPRGANVGVFAGVMHGNYQLLGGQLDSASPAAANSPYWSVANRISYFMNWHGPSMAVDTACSSSLAAVHLACESIRRGECRAALAGGVNLLLHPRQYIVLSQMRMLSHAGSCQPFGAGADGIVVGEGVGAVLLRPLRDAIAAGDRILGVIRGSAMNAGGRTAGYTVPSPGAQEELIVEALRKAEIDPATVTCLEAHGTGTSLGDPVEVLALTKAFRRFTSQTRFCAVGSVKSNIGHLEAAAGIASLTKVLLALREGLIPATLHCAAPNPHIDFADSPFFLASSPAPWNPAAGVRRAGISSFGAGGTNVHLVVEEFARPAAEPANGGREIVPLSARTPERLLEAIRRLDGYLDEHPEVALADVACTLQTGREPMSERLVMVAASIADLKLQLAAQMAGGASVAKSTVAAGAPRDAERDAQRAEALWRAGQLEALAELWAQGGAVRWGRLRTSSPGRRIALPTYPFEKIRHWLSGREAPRAAQGLHPLLDRAEPSLDGARFTHALSGDEWYLTDHQVGGHPVLPASAHLEAARAAAELAGRPVYGLSQVAFLHPLVCGEGERSFTLSLEESKPGLAFRIATGRGAETVVHSRGVLETRPAESAGPARLPLEEIRARCGMKLEKSAIYKLSRAAGVAYGPRFQSIQRLHCGSGEALAELSAPQECGMLLDPAVVDAALQSLMGVLVDGREAGGRAPFSIDRMAWTGDLAAARYVHVRRTAAGPDESVHADLWVADAGGDCLLWAQGVQLRRLKPAADDDAEANDFLALEKLGAAGMLDALQQIGVFRSNGETYSRADLRLRLRFAPKYDRLLDAFVEMLRRLGVLRVEGDALHTTPEIESAAIRNRVGGWRPAVEALAQRDEALGPHVDLLRACLDHYREILRGEMPATDIFFPGGSMRVVEGIYRGYGMADRFLTVLATSIRDRAAAATVAHPGEPLRILEVGAGTGGATTHVLGLLAELSAPVEFLYTDVSSGFTHHGKAAFGARYPFVEFKVLDIEKDPAAQGISARGFDVVFASNVLHATRNIARTLAHVKALVRPGGAVFLNEMTASRDFGTLTFGLLDGWWLYDDPASRLPFSPLLDVRQWRLALENAGFTVQAVHAVDGEPGAADAGQFTQCVLAAAADAPPAETGAGLDEIRATLSAVIAEVFEMNIDQVLRGELMSFTEFGADSILGAELVSKINQALGISLKTTAIFNHPNIHDLARFIHAEFGGAAESRAKAEPEAPPREPDLAEMFRRLESGQLSFAEAMERLPEELI